MQFLHSGAMLLGDAACMPLCCTTDKLGAADVPHLKIGVYVLCSTWLDAH